MTVLLTPVLVRFDDRLLLAPAGTQVDPFLEFALPDATTPLHVLSATGAPSANAWAGPSCSTQAARLSR